MSQIFKTNGFLSLFICGGASPGYSFFLPKFDVMRTKEAEMKLVYKLLHVLGMVRRSSDSFSVLQLNCYYEFLPI